MTAAADGLTPEVSDASVTAFCRVLVESGGVYHFEDAVLRSALAASTRAAHDPKGYLWSDQWAWAVERERALKVKVARVEALADEMDAETSVGHPGAETRAVAFWTVQLRAALAGDTETGADQ